MNNISEQRRAEVRMAASAAITDYERSLRRLMQRLRRVENEVSFLPEMEAKKPRLEIIRDHMKSLEELHRDILKLTL